MDELSEYQAISYVISFGSVYVPENDLHEWSWIRFSHRKQAYLIDGHLRSGLTFWPNSLNVVIESTKFGMPAQYGITESEMLKPIRYPQIIQNGHIPESRIMAFHHQPLYLPIHLNGWQ